MNLNKNIKQRREELSITQQDMAVMLGVSRVTYVKWESDPATMPLGKYEQLMTELARLENLREKLNEIQEG